MFLSSDCNNEFEQLSRKRFLDFLKRDYLVASIGPGSGSEEYSFFISFAHRDAQSVRRSL
jgi:hypothetical protein